MVKRSRLTRDGPRSKQQARNLQEFSRLLQAQTIFASERTNLMIGSGSPERRVRKGIALSHLLCWQLLVYMWSANGRRARAVMISGGNLARSLNTPWNLYIPG